jgi:hypothetical protein
MTARPATSTPYSRTVRYLRPWLIGSLLFLCILSGYLLSFNVDKPTHNADWFIRYQVACSLVERNAFSIRPYRDDGRTGPGVGGHKYAQYTLGQTTALIPLYVLGRQLAGLAHTDCDSAVAPPIVFLTAKLLDPLLGALLCVLFFATARLLGYTLRASLALTLLLAFGTALWPDVLSNEEHTMESLFLLAAAYAALRYTLARRKSRLWVLAMGVAAGLVFVTRVAGIIALPIFALYLLALHRRWRPTGWKRPFWRDLALFAGGVSPCILVNATYDVLRWGSPFRTGPYPDQSFGYPPWLGIPNLLISPGKGLIWYVPALFLLPVVARPFWRRFPLPTILFGIICGVYLLFYANVNYWHGDPAWGPRYLYPVLPYLILPLGELWRRWRAYWRPARGLVVGVLAASFLVQFAAVSVSFWRHWHYIYAYHYDQVENHAWGQNLNYWWHPEQSPIVISLAGIYDITQQYVDQAPLLQHPAEERLSNPYESCIFRVFGQASICLTDLDELRQGGNWNTFTMWWMHTYPWWSKARVIHLALGLLALFLASGGTLLALPAVMAALRRAPPSAPPSGPRDVHPAALGGNGHGQDAPRDVAALPELTSLRPLASTAGSPTTLVVEAPPVARLATPSVAAVPCPTTGLAALGRAALLAALVYAGIMNVAALRAPRQTPPLIRTVPMSATVRNGTWVYQVLRVTSVPALPGGLAPPVAAHHYTIVLLRLHNLSARPNHVRIEFFALTTSQGLTYPSVTSLARPAAELYHLMPMGTDVPARSVMDGALVYLVRDGASHLELLGPGITLVRL